MSILVTSVGTKVPLIECLKTFVSTEIIGCDLYSNVLSTYFLNDFFVVPKLEEVEINHFIEQCKKYKVRYILPTREADLLYFSSRKHLFTVNNIDVWSSSMEVIEKVNDKLLFSKLLLNKNLSVIPSFQNTEGCQSKSFVLKERYGAGSRNIFIDLSKEDVLKKKSLLQYPIIQPYIKGKEYSIDIYITKTKKVKAVVVRKRTLVIDGESQITEIVHHTRLEALISEAALALNLEGHVMFQAIEDENGELWIVECNARIGGASTLSIYAGLDTFNWWIAECNGENIDDWPVNIKKLKQVRYKKDLIL